VDNQHRMIPGYRDLSGGEIERMRAIKEMAGPIGTMLQALAAAARADGDRAASRYVDIARSHFEDGFIYAVKAVARPTDDLGALEL
jgi:hypothetical protein